jgi:hypothetical protein
VRNIGLKRVDFAVRLLDFAIAELEENLNLSDRYFD